MKYLFINSVCGIRSTGRICTDIAELLEPNNNEIKIAYGREIVPEQFKKYSVKIGSDFGVKLHALSARIFDNSGFGSKRATKRFIKWVEEYNPDVIHLHNLHGYYINIPILFDYLKKSGKPVFWSLYDCWSFTGHCAHFDFNGCSKWQNGCENCKFISEYPASKFIDNSANNYARKKEIFSNVPNLHIIAPSKWMKSMVEQSFLKDYPVHILPNGINLDNYKPAKSDFREKYGINSKFIVLGVASFWDTKKGIEYFIKLSEDLPREDYQVIMVGNTEKTLPLPNSIIHINSTNSVKELCEIYTAADVFVNPTLQETQGLTTVEALACGTPCVVFKSGGAAECMVDNCGFAVNRGDYKSLLEATELICKNKEKFSAEECKAQALKYDKNLLYKDFIRLYEII